METRIVIRCLVGLMLAHTVASSAQDRSIKIIRFPTVSEPKIDTLITNYYWKNDHLYSNLQPDIVCNLLGDTAEVNAYKPGERHYFHRSTLFSTQYLPPAIVDTIDATALRQVKFAKSYPDCRISSRRMVDSLKKRDPTLFKFPKYYQGKKVGGMSEYINHIYLYIPISDSLFVRLRVWPQHMRYE